MKTLEKKNVKVKQIKSELLKELNFIKNIFKLMPIPIQMKGTGENEEADYEIYNGQQDTPKEHEVKRAKSIVELEEKLEKMKSHQTFNLKAKLAKKSLTSKLNKKLKKKQRLGNKQGIKPVNDGPLVAEEVKLEKKPKAVNSAKPVFNTDGKLVFSKFDFANIGRKEKTNKAEKDPKKILENLKKEEEKLKALEETEDSNKVKEIKEKIAWKNILQKAEGQKIKDDPTLLKKSIKKIEQKKNQSKKKWENRIQNVQQMKEERQKKRKENITKKKKEKKSKIIKTAVKRGRVVIN